MYKRFYGFNVKPFSKTPDPGFFYLSRGHREALARLRYAVEERETVLLTGDVGCGKTTLSRCLLDSLDGSYLPIVIVNPVLAPGELLRFFALRLGVEQPGELKSELMGQLGERLFDYYQRRVCPVLIIDEAQLLPGKESLDELRLLTNLQLDDANMFSLVLLGQPELRTRLLSGYYEPLRQRIGVQYHLSPLKFEELLEYIDFRLKTAGRNDPLFTQSALEEIYRFSGGVPRRINNLTANALLEGFSRDAGLIDGDVIVDVARDFGLI